MKTDESLLNADADAVISDRQCDAACGGKLGAAGLSQILVKAQNALDESWKRQAYEIIKGHEDELEEYVDRLPLKAKLLLGDIYRSVHDLRNAEKWFVRVVDLGYENYILRVHLGVLLMQTGRICEGMEVYHKLLDEVDNKIEAMSCYIFGRHYDPEVSREELFSLHKEWGRLVGEKISPGKNQFQLKRSGKIRVGYVSPDFRDHSVTFFMAPLIGRHDRERFEIYGYGNVKNPDSLTERVAKGLDVYRNIYGLSDDEAADMIIDDEIDILVDLAGHTINNRLLIFARKPAPIQVTYLGYPNTTGLETMDYRLTDSIAESEGCEEYYTEKPVFLPGGFLCYKTFENVPEVGGLPAKENGYVTFGSFNNNVKLNPYIIGIWSKILVSLKGSKMILKLKHGDDGLLRENYYRLFAENGVCSERVEIYNHLSKWDHYNLYNKIDIALDTFPYNGTTTTCEGMWMGVPLITLVGEHHMSRVGASLLTKAGLEYFATKTEEEYVAKALVLAGNIESLSKIRSSMRDRMINSGLCDGVRFTREVERAYEQMVSDSN